MLTLNLLKEDIIELTRKDIDLIRSWHFNNLDYIRGNVEKVKESFQKVAIYYMHTLIRKNNDEFNVYVCSEENKWMYLYGFRFDFEENKKNIINNINIPLIEIFYVENRQKTNIATLPVNKRKEVEQWMGQDVSIIMFVNEYMSLNQESIIRQTRTHTKKVRSKKAKRAGKKPKVKLIKQNIIRLNTDHIPEPTEEEKRLYERHTFGWTVRGHWRHYQSGENVWIKPQIRGDKDKVEGKIYEI